MSRLLNAIISTPWAIEPGALQMIARIAQRQELSPETARHERERHEAELQRMAGPGAQKLAGASRAYVVDGGIAVLPLTGSIFPRANMMTDISGATSITMLTEDYRRALASQDVGAVMLMVDSPGGAVTGIQAFAQILADGSRQKPSTVFVPGTAASAAYWIGSAANEIVIAETGLVGSIGVVAGVPVQVAPDANGEIWLDIVSSNAPNKRPDATTEDGLSEIRSTLDAIEKIFIADVAKGRKVTADKVKTEFGAGGVKVGSDAVRAGMADRVGTYESTLNAMRRQVANQRKLNSLKR